MVLFIKVNVYLKCWSCEFSLITLKSKISKVRVFPSSFLNVQALTSQLINLIFVCHETRSLFTGNPLLTCVSSVMCVKVIGFIRS